MQNAVLDTKYQLFFLILNLGTILRLVSIYFTTVFPLRKFKLSNEEISYSDKSLAQLVKEAKLLYNRDKPRPFLYLKIIALIIFILGFLLTDVFNFLIGPILTIVLLFLTYFWGIKILFKARELEQKTYLYYELKNSVKPILFLRSFIQDDSKVVFLRALFHFINLYRYAKSPILLVSEEESLVESLKGVAPVIAIGRPHEDENVLGAFRFYSRSKGDDWKNSISFLVEKSQLVILKAGLTEGLYWEFNHVFHNVNPNNIIVLVDMGYENYSNFRILFNEWTNRELPEADTINYNNPFFIYFNSEYTPTVTELKAPTIRTPENGSMVINFHYGLKLLYEKRGWKWQTPPFQFSRIFLIFLYIILFLIWLSMFKFP